MVYRPLSPKRSEIRLLTLHPDQGNSIINTTLQVESLDEALDFEALSYVWGDASIRKPIVVDGSTMMVTTNLEVALRQLRDAQSPRVVWADAVCINQQDVDERNSQIPIMGRIYSTARVVIAWLGEEHECPHFRVTLSWMQDSPYWKELKEEIQTSSVARLLYSLELNKARLGFLRIAARPYWTRMWTFPEFELARSEPLCCCGPWSFRRASYMDGWWSLQEEMSLVDYALAVVYAEIRSEIETLRQRSISYAPDPPSSGQHWQRFLRCHLPESLDGTQNLAMEVADRMHRAVLALEREQLDLMIQAQDHRGVCGPNKLVCSFRGRGEKERSFVTMVTSTSSRCSTDPRDRIYALHGLYPELKEAVAPDYGKPVPLVMQEATAFGINSTKDTRLHDYSALRFMLSQFSLFENRFGQAAFASWAVNLNMPTITQTHYCRIPKILQDHTSENLDQVIEDNQLLELHGRQLGVLTQVLWGRSQQHCHATSSEDQVATMISKTINNMDEGMEAFVRICSVDVLDHAELSDEQVLQQVGRAVEERVGGVELQPNQDNSAGDLLSEIAKFLADKTIATADGRFGLCPVDAKAGDLVVIGSRTDYPLVLRPGTRYGDKSPCYRLVGLAYFEGVCEDWGLDTELVIGLAERPIEKFNIT
ncbi:heterokaryon incompatibility protein-domain-containing protein [Podospora aff. communis PSN243]|uniref:Heterokaryon incompatibility protein-domain-containing protein n=1 Tax=Podospora aff. communis PSN243 TaxID=3040156 RepID=A0AAV9GAE5_9PEZI|nr:heterokaryon incompatibility protein-domain-containing protein [Podospora aff. communis PSN243]